MRTQTLLLPLAAAGIVAAAVAVPQTASAAPTAQVIPQVQSIWQDADQYPVENGTLWIDDDHANRIMLSAFDQFTVGNGASGATAGTLSVFDEHHDLVCGGELHGSPSLLCDPGDTLPVGVHTLTTELTVAGVTTVGPESVELHVVAGAATADRPEAGDSAAPSLADLSVVAGPGNRWIAEGKYHAVLKGTRTDGRTATWTVTDENGTTTVFEKASTATITQLDLPVARDYESHTVTIQQTLDGVSSAPFTLVVPAG